MKIQFYGTRGSLPVCSPEFMEFGGNTTCMVISFDDSNHQIVIDAGTGIRQYGIDRNKRHDDGALLFCFSHFHWDHIQGLPFFSTAYQNDAHLIFLILEKAKRQHSIKEVLAGQMMPEYFPVPLENMGGNFYFAEQPGTTHEFMRTRILGKQHSHPGGAYGFRFERKEMSIVVRTDCEYPDGISEEDVQFCRDVDILVHDAQYTAEELEQRKGWGHSSYDQVIELAKRANVKKLVMTHHDPDHDDSFLAARELECQLQFPNCVFSREKMSLHCQDVTNDQAANVMPESAFAELPVAVSPEVNSR